MRLTGHFLARHVRSVDASLSLGARQTVIYGGQGAFSNGDVAIFGVKEWLGREANPPSKGPSPRRPQARKEGPGPLESPYRLTQAQNRPIYSASRRSMPKEGISLVAFQPNASSLPPAIPGPCPSRRLGARMFSKPDSSLSHPLGSPGPALALGQKPTTQGRQTPPSLPAVLVPARAVVLQHQRKQLLL